MVLLNTKRSNMDTNVRDSVREQRNTQDSKHL